MQFPGDALEVFYDREPHSAALNMAIDEALLESRVAPALRFYRWEKPALSFGYFGLFAEVAAEKETRDLVRRWTGGGIVLHGDDLTYSLILPTNRKQRLPPAREIYSAVHEAIRRALLPHLPVELASQDSPKLSASCFANPVAADVISRGQKIAGAAQRRTRAGLLQQGSIQQAALPADFAEDFARELFPNFTRQDFPQSLLERAQDLAEQKYGTEAWLRSR